MTVWARAHNQQPRLNWLLYATLNMHLQWKINRFACLNMTACSTHYCNLTLKSRTEQLLNVECNFIRPQFDAHFHVKVFYRFNIYKPFLIDVLFDFCDHVGPRRQIQNPLMSALMPFFLRHSNLNHSCPFDGLMFVRGFVLNQEILQGAHVPSGKYRVDLRVFHKATDENMITVKIWLTVPTSGVSDVLTLG